MALLDELQEIVRTVYSEEGVKDSFLGNSTVQDLIEEKYLNPEFRDYSVWKDLKKSEKKDKASPYFDEKQRRKDWVDQNVGIWSDSVKPLPDIGTISQIQRFLTDYNTQTALSPPVSVSSVPGQEPFLEKENVKNRLPKIFNQFLYENVLDTTNYIDFLILVNALFGTPSTFLSSPASEFHGSGDSIYNFVPFLKLNEIFGLYFSSGKSGAYNFFRSIEIDEDHKNMYDIDKTSNLRTYIVWQNRTKRKDSVALPFDQSSQEDRTWTVLEKWYDRNKDEDGENWFNGTNYFYNYIYYPLQQLLEDEENFQYPLIGEEAQKKLREYFSDEVVSQFASTLAKTYGYDSDVVELFRSFLKNLGYNAKEVNQFLTTMIFPDLDFSGCVTDVVIEEETDTEQCIVTSYDPMPADWTTMDLNKIFYDEKKCSYVLSIKTAYQSSDGDLSPKKEEYAEPATKQILDLIGKFYSEEELNALSKKIVFSSHYINPKPLLKMRFLYKLSKLEVDLLGDATTPSVPQETVFISYNTNQFFDNIVSLAQKLKSYQRQYVKDIYLGTGIKYNNLDFLLESDNLYSLKTSIINLIHANTKNSQLYNILELGFDLDENNIVSATLLGGGLKDKKLKIGFKSFSMESSQKSEMTLNFIRNLEDITHAFQISKDLRFDKFITDFMKPEPRKQQQSSINMISRATNSGLGICENLGQTQKQFASTKVIGQRSIEFLKDEILKGAATTFCLTKEEKEKVESQNIAAGVKKRRF